MNKFSLVLLIYYFAQVFSQNCIFKYDEFPKHRVDNYLYQYPLPLILKHSVQEFLNPSYDGKFTIQNGDSFRLQCSGNNNYFSGMQSTRTQSLTIKCENGNFKNGNNVVSIRTLSCVSVPENVIKFTTTSCLNSKPQAKLYRVMVKTTDKIRSNDEIKVFEGCYNAVTRNTYYTKQTMNKDAYQGALHAERPMHWKDSSRIGYKHYKTMSSTLNRGHFTAMADFPHYVQQIATFNIENAAPQAITVNNGNWRRVEEAVRRHASMKSKTLTIWTGGYGRRKASNNNDLCLDSLGNTFCVPQYYWKVIKDEHNNAIAFVTVNDVVNTVPKLCTDKCRSEGWNTISNTNLVDGFTICCDVADFVRSRTSEFPNFGTISSILNFNN